jgi:diguanylate cyclase (GGDEF)-like protein
MPVVARKALTDGDRIRLGKATVVKFTLHDELERSFHRQMYESTVRDPLTQVFNRKYLTDRLRSELSYARRHAKSLSLLMLDIDHFKNVNDTLGHLAGDAALRALAALLIKQLRAEDVVARYGGEEFVLLARGIPAQATMVLAERVRKAVEAMLIPWEPTSIRITVSVGVGFTADGAEFATPDDLVARADENLYAAKAAGRNRVVM